MKTEIKSKIIKGSLFALALSPIATNFVPMSASELAPKDLPGVDGRPEEPEVPSTPEPTPPTTPEEPVQPEEPEVPSTPEPTPPSKPTPQPPVYEPTITQEVSYTSTSNEAIVVKQGEVGNVLGLANINIVKTTTTKEDGVVVGTTTENVNPVLVGSVDSSLGVKTITYTTTGTDKQWTFTANVVSDNAVVSQDRGVYINVGKPKVSLTQTQALAMTSYDEFVELHNVSAGDANGNYQIVVLPKQVGAVDVRAGKVGTHTIEFGIAKDYSLTKNVFIATAECEVVEDGSNVNDSITDEGLKDNSQLKGETGNTTTKEENETKEDTLQQGGYSYQGVKTGISSQYTMLSLLTTVVVSVISLFIIKKNK